MAIRYYDDIIVAKLRKWAPQSSKLRILNPEETKRLLELQAIDSKDKPLELPCLALSRNNDLELLLNIKNTRSYDGLRIEQTEKETGMVNTIPVKVQYQIDIYTKTAEEGDDYVREYLFKLINNPTVKLELPYYSARQQKVYEANLRVLNTISNTSAISERIFPGQFTRWTIQMELQDAYLFDVVYKDNWKLYVDDEHLITDDNLLSSLEAVRQLDDEIPEISEPLPMQFKTDKS